MGVPFWQVDAFTAEPFAGNPAAVCLLERPRDAGWMQRVAAEMNLSETAFLLPEGAAYGLRWFTPTTEVELCGHATLASAHVLFAARPELERARFLTRSGELAAARRGERIELDFPALPPRAEPPPAGLLEALGARGLSTHRSRFDLLVELESEDAVRALRPDFRALAAASARGVIATAPGAESDFVSRFFAPAVGIDEDPVTGSAHCVLAPFWSPRLGKTAMRALQLSRRGGEVHVRLEGDRVLLAGHAVTVLEGELHA